MHNLRIRLINISLFYLSIFALSCNFLFAQHPIALKGKVISSDDQRPLENVSITILNSKDSILMNSTRSKKDGTFIIKNLVHGRYLLSASHIQYVAFKQEFVIQEEMTIPNFDQIKLEKKTINLEEVAVNAKTISAITLKGDTLEFLADSFKVRENARVEDLLRQFPNFEIDKSGNITANGEKVKRVLLEGEEFFGDDPTLITKNIRAGMVDKIQLYDGESEQTELAGSNFGTKEKTVNVTLKGDRKNGYFGKIQASGGLPKLHDAQGMLNSFNSKRKIAGYAILSNNGITGLGWEDRSNFGSDDFEINELDAGGGNFNGKGLPAIKTGGAHYDEYFNDKKVYINANYKVADLNVGGFEELLTKNIQPDNSFTRLSREDFFSTNLRNKIDLRVRMAMDSLNTFNLFVEGLTTKNDIKSDFFDNSFRENGIKLNESRRNLYTNRVGSDIKGFFVWNRKFNKESSISFRLNAAKSGSNSERTLLAENSFYDSLSAIDSVIDLKERRLNTRSFDQYGTKIAYTNRFGEGLTLITEYELSIQNSNNNTNIYNLEDTNPNFKDALKYKLEQSTHKARTSLGYSKRNFQVTVTPGIELNKQIQENYQDTKDLRRNFINWYPNFETKYTFSRKNRILFSYNGGTVQPNIDQIQPIQINDDPLNIFVGNPSLTPSFKQSFSLNYRDYILMEDKTILLNGLYTVERNAIVPSITTDSIGKSIYEYTNLENFQPKSFDFYLIYSFNILPIETKLNSDIGYTLTKNANYVNQSLNENSIQKTNFSLRMTKRNIDRFDLTILFNTKYNTIESSLDKNLNATYWTYLIVPEFQFYPTKRLEVAINASYDYQEPISILSQKLERFIVNFSVAKSFLKNQSLILRASANDIFNQNKGFQRFVNNNLIVESTYSSIGRNLSLGLTWDINQMGD